MTKKAKDRFFVISGAADRTRHETEASAIEHAKTMLEKAKIGGQDGRQYAYIIARGGVIYVVKLVKVVEITKPPISVRAPNDKD